MRFIHTADWHLGRVMYGVRLLEDQAHVLDQLILAVADSKPDAVFICGDVYDRAVPSTDAVELLDYFLSRCVLGMGVPVIIIAGNHDSPVRLGFGSSLMASSGLHVFGSIRDEPAAVTFQDRHGPVRVYPIAFAEPSVVREKLARDDVRDHEQALKVMIEMIRNAQSPRERTVILAHAYVAGSVNSESERPLSIGGADTVDASCFEGFHYTALGHLHRPQRAGADSIRYSGSLLKYSFSEADHAKSVTLVELGEPGQLTCEPITLGPKRDMRKVEGFLKDVLERSRTDEHSDDYVLVSLLDTGAILDAMGKLRHVYPNIMHLERPALAIRIQADKEAADARNLGDLELFSSFFAQVTGEPPDESQAAAYLSVVQELRRAEGEGMDS